MAFPRRHNGAPFVRGGCGEPGISGLGRRGIWDDRTFGRWRRKLDRSGDRVHGGPLRDSERQRRKASVDGWGRRQSSALYRWRSELEPNVCRNRSNRRAVCGGERLPSMGIQRRRLDSIAADGILPRLDRVRNRLRATIPEDCRTRIGRTSDVRLSGRPCGPAWGHGIHSQRIRTPRIGCSRDIQSGRQHHLSV